MISESPNWHTLEDALSPRTLHPSRVPHALRSHKRRGKVVVFTSLSRLYLPKARLFAASLRKFNPDWEYHILMNDSWPDDEGSELENVDLIVPIRQLAIDRKHGWIFGQDAEELCCASRPFYFLELLKHGYEHVFFFDPDIEVFSSLTPLLDELKDASILLTPHMNAPAKSDAEIYYSEMSVLAHGVFNLGFLGARNTSDARKVIEFWRHRLTRYSLKEHAKGLWTDQKWFNLVPVFFDGVKVLSHAGCNVSSWNISNRPITGRGGDLYAGECQLLFFHFSGFDKGVPKRMYEIFRSYNSDLEILFDSYQNKHRYFVDNTPISKIDWIFSNYDNGEKISFGARRFYRGTLDNRLKYRAPFYCESKPSFWADAAHLGFEWINNEYDPPQRLVRHF
ncbi:MAG: putative nucleotide-diphospho-sugar transferase [Alphaproteobacteria bacterium]|nr:putative nucleotide-diphospho-sugar transferase [Alphaproteobacteria bacterium]